MAAVEHPAPTADDGGTAPADAGEEPEAARDFVAPQTFARKAV